jgi:hypothetical protein
MTNFNGSCASGFLGIKKSRATPQKDVPCLNVHLIKIWAAMCNMVAANHQWPKERPEGKDFAAFFFSFPFRKLFQFSPFFTTIILLISVRVCKKTFKRFPSKKAPPKVNNMH